MVLKKKLKNKNFKNKCNKTLLGWYEFAKRKKNRGVRQIGKKVVRELGAFLEWKNKGAETKMGEDRRGDCRQIFKKQKKNPRKQRGDGPESNHAIGLINWVQVTIMVKVPWAYRVGKHTAHALTCPSPHPRQDLPTRQGADGFTILPK